MRTFILFLFGATAIFAQPFSAGIKGGIPFTDFLSASQNGTFNYSAPTQRYIIGGVAELRFPFGVGVEFDALYRKVGYTGSGILDGALTTVQASGSNWEFPLLLKYRFPFPLVRPYVDAGVAWDTLTGLKQSINSALPLDQTGLTSSDVRQNTTLGVVLGAGVDIHAIVVHISPEIRFTRWNSQQVSDTAGLLHSNQNQAEFLVGITF